MGKPAPGYSQVVVYLPTPLVVSAKAAAEAEGKNLSRYVERALKLALTSPPVREKK